MELVPEYYFLPELYMNKNRQHTGLRQQSKIAGTKAKLFVD